MLLLRPDQRRPEAVLREMKAKARSITAKIEGRMDATRRSGGKNTLPVILEEINIFI